MKRLSLIACGAFAAMALIVACEPLAGGADPESSLYADNVVVVDDGISAAVIWTAGSVYLVDGYIRVSNGATLSIEPGAVVKFTAMSVLDIEAGGQVAAIGTAAAPIVFTSYRDSAAGGDSILNDGSSAPASGDWCGLAVEPGSSGNQFAHCEFRFGGRGGIAALKVSGTAAVDGCTFRDNLGGHPYDSDADYATLDASEAGSTTTVTNCVFYRNRWPLGIAVEMDLDATNAFSYDEDGSGTIDADEDNVHQAVYVNYGDITGSVTWAEAEVPLCFFGYLVRVKNTGTLTIASGAVLKNSMSDFDFDYGSTVDRTGATFTSFRDDSLSGDTNADGTASGPSDGDWYGVYVQASDDSWDYLTRNNATGAVRYSYYTAGD
ncbi:MAG: hypothetical protein CVV47_03205 [Spirochaetae bacterium HGW-Spirochaetae-3]|jgi:hypothetical protein|nr:MAG: hypothetical protein CVV47_03205 [Spirochaetae bacterium HGW-Spirochaetae-3]